MFRLLILMVPLALLVNPTAAQDPEVSEPSSVKETKRPKEPVKAKSERRNATAATPEAAASASRLTASNEDATPTIKITVFHLKYAEASSAEKILMQLLAGKTNLTIACDKRLNSLLISASPELLEQVKEIVKVLDSPAEANQWPQRTNIAGTYGGALPGLYGGQTRRSRNSTSPASTAPPVAGQAAVRRVPSPGYPYRIPNAPAAPLAKTTPVPTAPAAPLAKTTPVPTAPAAPLATTIPRAAAASPASGYQKFPSHKLRELRAAYDAQNRRAQQMAREIRASGSPTSAVKKQLRDAVQAAFGARQKLQREQLAEFSLRLKTLEKSLAGRERLAGQIVDRRVAELLDPNLKWDLDAQDVADAPRLGSTTVGRSRVAVPSVAANNVARGSVEPSTVPRPTGGVAVAGVANATRGALAQPSPSNVPIPVPRPRLQKSPTEFYDALAQHAAAIKQLQESIRRMEAKGDSKAEKSAYVDSINALNAQLEQETQRLNLARLEYEQHLKLLESRVLQERAQYEMAKKGYDRVKRLTEKGYEPSQALEQARLKQLAAKAALEQSEAVQEVYRAVSPKRDEEASDEEDSETQRSPRR